MHQQACRAEVVCPGSTDGSGMPGLSQCLLRLLGWCCGRLSAAGSPGGSGCHHCWGCSPEGPLFTDPPAKTAGDPAGRAAPWDVSARGKAGPGALWLLPHGQLELSLMSWSLWSQDSENPGLSIHLRSGSWGLWEPDTVLPRQPSRQQREDCAFHFAWPFPCAQPACAVLR